MRRFVTVLALLLFTIPFGISLTGCSKKAALVYCNGGDTGLTVGQLQTITLQPQLYGVSLNENQMGQVTAPTATDCKGNAVSVDQLHLRHQQHEHRRHQSHHRRALRWQLEPQHPRRHRQLHHLRHHRHHQHRHRLHHRQRQRRVQQRHPGLRAPHRHQRRARRSLDQLRHRPRHQLQPGLGQLHPRRHRRHRLPHRRPQLANGCCTTPPNTFLGVAASHPLQRLQLPLPDQDRTALRPRLRRHRTSTNISCQVGQIAYTAQTPAVVTIDQNGIATAQQPGSTIITTTLAQAGSTAGYFSTCPPVDIALTYPNTTAGTTNMTVDPNYTQPVTAVAKDKNGQILNGLTLEYTSTTPIPIPAASRRHHHPGLPRRGRHHRRLPAPQPAIPPPIARSASTATASRSAPTRSPSPPPEPTAPTSTSPAPSPATWSRSTSPRTPSALPSCCPTRPTPWPSATMEPPSTSAVPPS